MSMGHPKILHNLGCVSFDVSFNLEDSSYFLVLSLFFTLVFYRLWQEADMRVNPCETLNTLLFAFYKLSFLTCFFGSVFADKI